MPPPPITATAETTLPALNNTTATPLPSFETIPGFASLAYMEMKMTSIGEVSNGTIIELIEQFFSKQLLNGTAQTVTVTKIQRVGATTAAPTTLAVTNSNQPPCLQFQPPQLQQP
ncbi:hypothetical protein PFLUV_G00107090 [Perca fluviatilis]|uniref:Uncharacterized protein n=1 Tax=Perca fluviatilis TaxID=8168 RepID=A0A6A5F8L7_PERFL|nr:hypothetical protein PFLUV_G00107090 [Perca fluviatilis]